MKRLSFCLAILLTLSFGLAFAQAPGNTFIRLGTVTAAGGAVVADTIFFNGSSVVKFPIIYGNRDTTTYALSNAFRISSPDGANWAHAAGNGGNMKMTGAAATMPGIWVDTVGFIHPNMYDLVFKFNMWGADGTGQDTVMFSGAIGPSTFPGMPIKDSGVFFNIMVNAKIADVGKHICIDSSTNYPPTGSWKWPALYTTPAYNTFPTWSGLKCFILEKARNFPPVITNCAAAAQLTGSHCGPISFTFNGTDADGDAITWSVVSGPGAIVGANTSAVYTVNGLAAGTHTVVIGATDPAGSNTTTTCQFDVIATNVAPAITCRAGSLTVSAGNTVTDVVTATDDCDPKTFAIVTNPMVGAVSLNPSTGVLTFSPVVADSGDHCITVSVSDGTATSECNLCYHVILGCAYNLTIENHPAVIQGTMTNVDITLSKIDGGEGLGGFDLLIAYDNSALSFQAASQGTIYAQCGWEYFTYRYGANGNCSGGCPSGLIRVTGIAETNNGAVHPTCITPKYVGALPTTLASLQFLVSNNRTLECQFVPIRFFWADCGDNTLSNASGSKLYISCKVFEPFSPDPIDADGPLPTYLGAPNVCVTSTQKAAVVRNIDFTNGGVKIICGSEIDARGDINLNGTMNEIADAVMFTNYFTQGLSAFLGHVDGSIAATDVNNDGITLSVADLVYLIRVIVGDALPFPKPTNLAVNVSTYDSKVTITGSELGGVFMVLKGEVNPTLIANAKMEYAYDGANTRVLVHVPYDINNYGMALKGFTGDILNTQGAELVSIEMADVHGYKLDQALPSDYALLQNYPNPFNPSTKISFDMPKAGAYKVTVYNVTGQKVAEFAGDAAAGRQTITWDASVHASGVYFYKLETAGFTATKKAVLLK